MDSLRLFYEFEHFYKDQDDNFFEIDGTVSRVFTYNDPRAFALMVLCNRVDIQGLIKNKEFSAAFSALLRAVNLATSAYNRKKETPSVEFYDADLRRAQVGWRSEYIGETLKAFTTVVEHEESSWNSTKYAKHMAIVNSSGAGKSRLI